MKLITKLALLSILAAMFAGCATTKKMTASERQAILNAENSTTETTAAQTEAK